MFIDTPKRLAFFLPNTFTALNMACGFSSVIYASRGSFYNAAIILLLGAVFDSVDGRVARMTGTQSSFGEIFDSLSDVISFGLAPSLLIYFQFLNSFGRFGLVVSFVFLLCSALRLARFNSNIGRVDPHFFQGLPTPGAALTMIGLSLLSVEFPFVRQIKWIIPGFVLIISFFMISNIPFNSFKDSPWVKSHKKRVLFLIFVTIAAVVTYEQVMIFLLMISYIIGSLIYFFLNKGGLEHIFDWKSEEHDEFDH